VRILKWSAIVEKRHDTTMEQSAAEMESFIDVGVHKGCESDVNVNVYKRSYNLRFFRGYQITLTAQSDSSGVDSEFYSAGVRFESRSNIDFHRRSFFFSIIFSASKQVGARGSVVC
jgi:hypothetical protein